MSEEPTPGGLLRGQDGRTWRRGFIGDVPSWLPEAAEPPLVVAEPCPHLSADSAARKQQPIATGVLDYFPDAMADVARLSKIGNDKHNPGEPLHWSRGKSDDHADCILRHMIDRGTIDTDGVLHDTKVAWRALAQLQLAIEKRRGFYPETGKR